MFCLNLAARAASAAFFAFFSSFFVIFFLPSRTAFRAASAAASAASSASEECPTSPRRLPSLLPRGGGWRLRIVVVALDLDVVDTGDTGQAGVDGGRRLDPDAGGGDGGGDGGGVGGGAAPAAAAASRDSSSSGGDLKRCAADSVRDFFVRGWRSRGTRHPTGLAGFHGVARGGDGGGVGAGGGGGGGDGVGGRVGRLLVFLRRRPRALMRLSSDPIVRGSRSRGTRRPTGLAGIHGVARGGDGGADGAGGGGGAATGSAAASCDSSSSSGGLDALMRLSSDPIVEGAVPAGRVDPLAWPGSMASRAVRMWGAIRGQEARDASVVAPRVSDLGFLSSRVPTKRFCRSCFKSGRDASRSATFADRPNR